ncbi:glycosyltransferase family 39 protein [Tengunoibacter tsumagoiensis]|uniref:Uncharacterized protein n=1 Tax=Tengunoibacter tsumagoiensis TaxID=2014871 RepID=A0A402A4P3_9CHLR|nr:glycosyltransferase family 39 protein [Tengunoibacter tsumagoiensis]GCE14113.1 hypothetical protein KTT_39720 [Tengunoibacter tsumagoiensis]
MNLSDEKMVADTDMTLPLTDTSTTSQTDETAKRPVLLLEDTPKNSHVIAELTRPTVRQSAKNLFVYWFSALKYILPLYIAFHIGLLLIDIFSGFFSSDSTQLKPFNLWHNFFRWDIGYYMDIAAHGYTYSTQTAFFPLFSVFVRASVYLFHRNYLLSALFVSNVMGLIMLVVLYQLVREDFDEQLAKKAVLVLSCFPTAFFFAVGYNESLFICLAILSFYLMRRGQWWLAGFVGFLAVLTRSTGVLLVIPFCYEYLRQKHFRLHQIRWNILSVVLIPLGLGLFSLYCYYRFGDFLAFSHAQKAWDRSYQLPWVGIAQTITLVLKDNTFLSYHAIYSWLDIITNLSFLLLIILSAVGPLRFPRSHWSYIILAAVMFIFFQSFPLVTYAFPLLSTIRFMLELFPAFIVIAKLCKYRSFEVTYITISSTLLVFLSLYYVMGGWVA